MELEQRYTALEELQKSGNTFEQSDIDKELETLEKLQMKYNKIEAKRKKLAKQNYERVRRLAMLTNFCILPWFRFRSLSMLTRPGSVP